MKTLPAGLQAHLDGGATTLCWCWKLTRNDSVVLGFTDHDAPVPFGGVSYEAATGFTASEVQSSLGLSVDNLSVIGALSSNALNDDDLAAGLYDGAAIEIWRVNWVDPSQRVLMRKGTVGEVKRGKTAFEAEVRGLVQQLNQPIGRTFGYNCDADCGDARCGVNLAGAAFTGSGTITAVTDNRRFTASGLGSFATGWFTSGKITWTGGANAGRSMEVKLHGQTAASASIELWQAMSKTVAVGDTFSITAGCDKTFATCKAKFANGDNFRGFPHMIGNDAVVGYATSSSAVDGGSRYGN